MPYAFYLYDADSELIEPFNADLAGDDAARAQARAYLAAHRACEEIEIWQGRRYVGQGRRIYAPRAGGSSTANTL